MAWVRVIFCVSLAIRAVTAVAFRSIPARPGEAAFSLIAAVWLIADAAAMGEL